MQSYDQQISGLKSKLSSFKSIEVPRANASALNKTTAASKTRVVRGVAKAIQVPQKFVRKRMYVSRATARRQSSRLRAYYRGISVIDLKARDSGKGGWRTRKGRGVRAGKRRYSDAFIAYGNNANKHVFRRKGDGRSPLEVVRIEIQKHVDVIAPKVAMREMKENFAKRLKHDLEWRLRKYQV